MDFWSLSVGMLRLKRISNVQIRETIKIDSSIEIQRRQLVWYGHVERMTEEQLPKAANELHSNTKNEKRSAKYKPLAMLIWN